MFYKKKKYYLNVIKVACGAFSALRPVGRLYPCTNEFPSFISRGATHRIGTGDKFFLAFYWIEHEIGPWETLDVGPPKYSSREESITSGHVLLAITFC